jgi:hypothetical protein
MVSPEECAMHEFVEPPLKVRDGLVPCRLPAVAFQLVLTTLISGTLESVYNLDFRSLLPGGDYLRNLYASNKP